MSEIVSDAVASPPEPMRIAVAGASGFVGQALCKRLARDHAVLALGRRHAGRRDPEQPLPPRVPGRTPIRCDLFSIRQTETALAGADVAVYLVHSMSPNARLTQGGFEDLDLLLADNFGRAAARAGIQRIVYLGGLLPDGIDDPDELSPHLRSRAEVEAALAAHGVPVTALRAGLVVGAEGSSLRMMVRLVERLPVMICPSWTRSRTQPIALKDVIEILEWCCSHEESRGRICEVGGPDVMSYREMMQTTARVLGRKRRMIPVPLVTPGLSELWVAAVTRTSRSLVRPLIESLQHEMVVEDPWVQQRMGLEGQSFEDSLRESLAQSKLVKRPVARSVQRFRLPPGRDAAWVADEYPRWLAGFLGGFLVGEADEQEVRLGLRGLAKPLLVLRRRADRSDASRALLGVSHGTLVAADPSGDPRLEFRTTPDGRHVLVALQDYEPRLPWWLYAISQAPVHAFVMAAYGRYLGRLADAGGLQTERPPEVGPGA